MIGKDILDGVMKVKRIMSKTTYVCTVCGASHEHRNQATNCCAIKKQKKEHVSE